MKLLQCSDFHLDKYPRDDERRMAVVREHVERVKPDLIVFTGDLVDLGPQDRASLERGRDLLASFGHPFEALPGNHDVGNKISVGKHLVTREAVEQWCDIFASDRFVRDLGDWRIVGFNSQITGTDWPREHEQLRWLRDTISDARPTAVFMHMPPYLYEPDETPTGRDAYWQVDPKPRGELMKILNHPSVQLIASGHVHWHAMFKADGPMRIWSPACYSVVEEPHYPPGGDCTGMILYTLGETLEYELISDPRLHRPLD